MELKAYAKRTACTVAVLSGIVGLLGLNSQEGKPMGETVIKSETGYGGMMYTTIEEHRFLSGSTHRREIRDPHGNLMYIEVYNRPITDEERTFAPMTYGESSANAD